MSGVQVPGRPFGARPSYEVQLEQFSGPLDVLLYLVRREEMNIYDIPIARITEQYLQLIADIVESDVDRASDFLVMAATLLQIKARMLLPKPPKVEAPDELEAGDEPFDDPRAELVAQLVAYSRFRETAEVLRQRQGEQAKVFSRGQYVESAGERPLEAVDLPDLVAAFQEILREEWSWREVPREEIPLREKLREIGYQLARHPEGVRFTQLFRRGGSRTEIIVTFLAILELIRRKRAVAEQQDRFGEIIIRRAATVGTSTEEEE